MERSFSRTLESLRHQQDQSYGELLFTAESLLMYATQQLDSGHKDRLRLFANTPQLIQAVWEGESSNLYHQDRISVTVLENGLTMGVCTKDPSEPHRHIAIGADYARYGEFRVTRSGILEQPLTDEHLTVFSHHFETMTGLLGLTRVIKENRKKTS